MVYSACAQKVGMLRKLHRKVLPSALRRIYIGAVQPKMEYACAVWCGGPIGKVVKLRKTFCRQARAPLPPFQRRFDCHTLLLFCKIRSEVAPTYLYSLLPPALSSSGYKLRKKLLPSPKYKQKSTLSSFLSRAIMPWNDLLSKLEKNSLTHYFQKSATLSPEPLI